MEKVEASLGVQQVHGALELGVEVSLCCKVWHFGRVQGEHLPVFVQVVVGEEQMNCASCPSWWNWEDERGLAGMADGHVPLLVVKSGYYRLCHPGAFLPTPGAGVLLNEQQEQMSGLLDYP